MKTTNKKCDELIAQLQDELSLSRHLSQVRKRLYDNLFAENLELKSENVDLLLELEGNAEPRWEVSISKTGEVLGTYTIELLANMHAREYAMDYNEATRVDKSKR